MKRDDAWIVFTGAMVIAVLLFFAAVVRADDWPTSFVPKPEGMKRYAKTQYSQYLSITNGFDSVEMFRLSSDDNLFRRVNPNRIFPIAVSGGLHDSNGWKSEGRIAIPKGQYVRVWGERVEAGVRRPLPRTAWQFPEGTIFADLLSTDKGLFELRTITKVNGGWKFRTAYKDWSKAPANYVGARKACNECHERAGEQPGYGISWRGSDGIFSWDPFVEGTNQIDYWNKPVKHWNDQ